MVWHKVAKINDFSQKGILVTLEGRSIALFQSGQQVYAIDNICPHKGASLVEGHVDGLELICPWHAWTFDLKNGKSSLIPGASVKTYQVKIEKGEVYVKI